MDLFVQTTLYGLADLKKIVESRQIGKDKDSMGYQVPKFSKIPLAYSSYVCDGYAEIYVSGCGIAFEPTEKEVYACPTDSFNLMRAGRFLPNHEIFLFDSVKEMLEKYPSSRHFRADFQKYFRSLSPSEVYPEHNEDSARRMYNSDYCLGSSWNPVCNEIVFHKPMRIEKACLFRSREELEEIKKMKFLPEITSVSFE